MQIFRGAYGEIAVVRSQCWGFLCPAGVPFIKAVEPLLLGRTEIGIRFAGHATTPTES
jgi:hypothetical protein